MLFLVFGIDLLQNEIGSIDLTSLFNFTDPFLRIPYCLARGFVLFLQFADPLPEIFDGHQIICIQIFYDRHQLFMVCNCRPEIGATVPSITLIGSQKKIVLHIIHDRRFLPVFQNLPDLMAEFHKYRDPFTETFNGGLQPAHELIGRYDVTVQVADICRDSSPLHRRHGRSHMDGRQLVNALTLIGTKVHTLLPVIAGEVFVLDICPGSSPEVGIAAVVPVVGHRHLDLPAS